MGMGYSGNVLCLPIPILTFPLKGKELLFSVSGESTNTQHFVRLNTEPPLWSR
jgi:hypothetical protein